MDSKFFGYFLVAFSGVLFGLIIFGGKVFSNFGLSLFELSTLPFVFSLFFLLPFVVRKKYWVGWKNLPLLLWYGLVEAATSFLQFAGLIFGAPVAVVVLLLYVQPLWTTIISFLFLKEKVTRWHFIACIIVIFGVFFLVNPSELFVSSSFIGIFLALLAGIFLSLWVVLGSVASKRKINPISIKFFVGLFGLVLLFLFFPVLNLISSDVMVVGFSLDWPIWVWGLLILYNLFAITLGHIIYYKGVKLIPAASAGILLLLEPIVATILAAIFLFQPVTPSIFLGGLLILAGNALVIIKS